LITFHFLFLLRIVHIFLNTLIFNHFANVLFVNAWLWSTNFYFQFSIYLSCRSKTHFKIMTEFLLLKTIWRCYSSNRNLLSMHRNLLSMHEIIWWQIHSNQQQNFLRTILYCSKIDNTSFEQWIRKTTSRIDEQSIFREKSTRHFANENIESSSKKVEIERKSCEQIDTK
jgi:hypothetical protein